MGEISIKINIADRVYPLKVNMEEEEIIRRAARLINDRIKEYQENKRSLKYKQKGESIKLKAAKTRRFQLWSFRFQLENRAN